MKARYCERGGAKLLGPGIVASILGLCSMAHGQAWLPDRNYTEGPGFKAGQMEIHAGLAARAGYNNNLFFSDDETNPRRGTGLLSVSPHINVSTQGKQRDNEGEVTRKAPPKIRLRSGADANLIHYFREPSPPTNVEVGADINLEIMPERPVGLELNADYRRRIQPFTELVAGDDSYVSNQVNVGGRLKFQSKGGVLTAAVGYRPQIERYASDTAFTYLNGDEHVLPVNMAWKFLPQTAMLYDAQVAIKKYKTPVGQSSIASVLYTDYNAFRSRLGINGALTNSLALQVMVGAAFGFYKPAEVMGGGEVQLDEYQQPIGLAKLTWRFANRSSRLSVAYDHDVSPSYVGGWVARDRGSAALEVSILSVVALGFEFGLGRYHYGNMLDQSGNPLGEGGSDERKDLRLDAAVRAEYRITNWLALMADATVQYNDSDFSYDNGTMTGPVVDPASYTQFQVYGGVRAHY